MDHLPLPDLSIRQLEYLVAVADSTTWAAAAADVGVSPSALSQGLAELERRIGVDLFEPDGRRRVLRRSALPVLDHARQVVSLTRDLTSWSNRLRSARSGRVRLGLIDVAAESETPMIALAASARIVEPMDREMSRTLASIPSASLSVVHVGYRRDELGRESRGRVVTLGRKKRGRARPE